MGELDGVDGIGSDLILVGCVSAKLEHAAPAKDLYVSPLFDRRRRYAEASGRPWFIYSALYGLIAPDDRIEPYDVSLKDASPAQRRAMGERVVAQLESRFGPLNGRRVEVHAGASYVEGLEPALKYRGARCVVPLAGLRLGEQLHWYGVHSSGATPVAANTQSGAQRLVAPAAAGRPKGDSTSEPVVIAVRSIGPFTFRWPAGVEAFGRGWECTVSQAGVTKQLRLGVGHRVVYGLDRVHVVVWLHGSPMVEGVAADDYADSGGLISLLRVAGRELVRSADELPAGYAGFQIVEHADEIRAKYTRHALAVKLTEDDLLGWARHAILRAESKSAPSKAETKGGHPVAAPKPAPRLTAPPSPDQHAVARELLAFGATNPAGDAQQGDPVFSPNPDANRLVIEDPFAYLVAVIFDQGITAERAWTAPYLLRQRLGHLEPGRVANELDAVAAAVQEPPKLHRFVNNVPAWIVSAARRVVTQYRGDAARIWTDEPATAAVIRGRFDAFDGIGQKKAAMAVEILARDLGRPIAELSGSDIAFDVHVRRVFLRTGLAQQDDADHMIAVARELNPERPGALDLPAWVIGRQWCRPGVPLCADCPIVSVCPRLVDQAAGVSGV